MLGLRGGGLLLRCGVRIAVASLVALGALIPAAPAMADSPRRLDDQITDRVGALEGRTDEVRDALDQLRSTQRLQLFVVYVRSFDGTPAEDWAREAAVRSDLGQNDAVLAVATHDRAYAYSVDADTALTDAQLAEVAAAAIEPALAENDWAGAAIGAADGYRAVLSGQAVPAPEIQPGKADPGGGGFGGWLIVAALVLVVAAGVLIAVLVSRRRRRPVAPAGPSTAELASRADVLLVGLDDALRTSQQELDMATATYGAAATERFGAALAAARQQIAEAFRLRQLIDDGVPEPEATHRTWLTDIIGRCESAGQALDAEAAAFDALRELEAHVGESAAELATRRAGVEGRLADTAAVVTRIGAEYTGGTAASVAGNVDQARERLTFVGEALTRAEAARSGDDRPTAALAVRGAEEALGQATALLDAVGAAATELDGARSSAVDLLAEVDTEIAAGRGVLGRSTSEDAAVAAAVAAAQQVADAVRGELAAPAVDPITALRRLREVDAELDRVLAGVREAADQTRRAQDRLGIAIGAARAEIAAAEDFVTTRRGAVGSTARTRLAEARRHLDLAVSTAGADPVAALAAAERSDALAEEALRSAQSDVDGWSSGQRGRSGGDQLGSVLGELGGAILGGILVGGASQRGGYGGRSWGSGVPGSFGGGGTRARRGGGGRF